MSAPLRLLVFDRTCKGPRFLPGLSHAWAAGRHLYRGLGRLDGALGAASWSEALAWLAAHGGDAPIAEIQYWGHGTWGNARLGGELLDRAALAPRHPLWPALDRVRARMLPGDQGLWWFRTCETFGTSEGQAFASAWTDFLGCRAAGHTHVIGFWQSGLHALSPGVRPHWSAEEGLRPGSQGIAAPSGPGRPNTITCLHGRVPDGF